MISVLIVDDEPDFLKVACGFLRYFGDIAVEAAGSGEVALDLIKKRSFDAVVSDYEMPGMDGIELLKEIRRGGDSTPFIVFTGKGREVIAMNALNFGADFYLQKEGGDPAAQFAELRNMIITAVERRQAQRESKILTERVEQQAQILDEILSGIPDPVYILTRRGMSAMQIVWGRVCWISNGPALSA